MKIDLTDTSSSSIQNALTQERHRLGSPAVGMVLTFVVVAGEHDQKEAGRAAAEAARQHPCRILVVIAGTAKGAARLDAEIEMGSDIGPGETVTLRLYGPLRHHPGSVVLPLLLTDAPTVTWWSGNPPEVVADDQLGTIAQRRVTDAAACSKPEGALIQRGRSYHEGDTDLAWSRATPWRSLLAAALDRPHGDVQSASVAGERANPTAALLAAWLSDKLGVEVDRKTSKGPGITAVRLETARGEIALTRPDGRLATLSRPAQPDRRVGLHRRTTEELLVEELRWLDADEVYGETVQRASADLSAASATSGH